VAVETGCRSQILALKKNKPQTLAHSPTRAILPMERRTLSSKCAACGTKMKVAVAAPSTAGLSAEFLAGVPR